MSTTIVIGPVLTSFLHCWEPKAPKGSTKLQYSTQLVFDANDKKLLDKINAAIDAAKEEGKAKLEGTPVKKQRSPIYDGEDEFPGDPFYKGKLYLNASNTRQPGIVKKIGGQPKAIINEDEMYSGVWVYAEINFFAYNNVGVGVSCSLQNLCKAKDGPRLDGRKSAEETFAAVDFGDTEEDESAAIAGFRETLKEAAKESTKKETAKEDKPVTAKAPSPFDD